MPTFEDFWEAWPRKVSRKPAETKWGRMTESQQLAALADVQKRNRMKYWSGNPRLIPHAATYLNQERWNDQWVEDLKVTDDKLKPNSGPVSYVPRDDLSHMTRWQALANRLFLRYVHASGGLPADTLVDAIKVKNRLVSENSRSFDEECEGGDQKEAVWTFANLLIDHWDGLTGRPIKDRILREGRT